MKRATIYEINEAPYTHMVVFVRKGFRSYKRRFRNLEDAEKDRDAYNEKLLIEGLDAIHIGARERDIIVSALRILDGTGISLIKAAEIAKAQWKGSGGGREIVPLVTDFLTEKERRGRDDKTRLTLKNRINAWIKYSGIKRAGEIDRHSIEHFVLSFKNTTTQRNTLAAINNFCGWLARREILQNNPAANIERPRRQPKSNVAIFRPAEALIFLRRIEANQPEYAAFFAVLLFAFLRPGEASELEKDDLRKKTIRVTKGKMRGRRRRLVPIRGNLRAWLDDCEWKIPSDRQLRKCRDLSPATWKEDICRHTGISYRLAETDDEKQTAREAGNSPEVIYADYYELTGPEKAKLFHAIRPKKIQ